MKKLNFIIVLLLLSALVPSSSPAASENGSFGVYLVGYVDSNPDNVTLFQIINPTWQELTVLLAFFDLQGRAIGCQKADLLPNGMLEMGVSSEGRPDYKPPVAKANVVKIVSVEKPGGKPLQGIVGFQRHYYPSRFLGATRISESNLPAIPEPVLLDKDRAEFKKILGVCYP